MATGRRPKPTALKILEGNPGKRPLNQNEPQAAVLVEARPPRGMTKRARAYWRSLAPILIRMRVLTEADVVLLRKLCEALDDVDGFNDVWRTKGATYETKNKLGEYCIKPRPEVAMANAWEQRILRMMASLGLDPSARSRVKVQVEAERDPFEEFLSGG